MAYLLALDQGTSSSRSIVFDGEGRLVALAQRELTQHYPQPGWVEHDPDEIWAGQLATAREALDRAGVRAQDIIAIGITNQRETTVVWDRRSGRPIAPAIVWQDRRTQATCDHVMGNAPLAHAIRERTGLVVDPYFSATKLGWLLDHVPDARRRAEAGELAFGTVDSWLLWQLTGGTVHATDVSNAARTMLYDIDRGQWDDGLLQAFHIPRPLLPQVLPSAHRYGESLPELLGTAVPICGVAGDQQAALVGQACFQDGQAKNTYGTGCFLLRHTGGALRRSAHGLVSTRAAQCGPQATFALEGSVFVGGAVVQWLRDGLRAITNAADVEALARTVPDAGGVVFVPAFTGLGAPYWAPGARGSIVGLTRGSTVAHIARAALESIAFQSAALLQAMNADAQAGGGTPVETLRVDGGASANALLMQFQADLLCTPVVRPRCIETTALGAAFLAGLGSGLYAGEAEVAALWQEGERFEPRWSKARAAEHFARWEEAVTPVLNR